MLSSRKIILLLFMSSLSWSSFCQNFEPKNSSVINSEVNFEINYYISNGNIKSVRILTDGILLKYLKKNGRIKIFFIRNKKLDYFQFLKIQLFIDSVLWQDNSFVVKSDSIQVLGLPETIVVVNIESLESRTYNLKRTDSEIISNLIELMNDYIPKRFQKKVSIPNRKLN